MHAKTETNQVFAVVPVARIERLKERFRFYVWENLGEGRAVVRLLTTWATDVDQLEQFARMLQAPL